MKKISIVLAVACIATSFTSQSLAIMFLENNTGAPIEFIEKAAEDADTYLQAKRMKADVLQPKSRATLVQKYFEPNLSIRTIGGSFYDISGPVQQALREKEMRKHENAIISVTSGWMYGLGASLSWQAGRQ
jgi:hypothetical protein